MLDCRVARIVGMEDLLMSKPRMDGFREGAPALQGGGFLVSGPISAEQVFVRGRHRHGV